MTHFACLECGCVLWLADSRLLGRCLECRYIERNERLRRLVAEQRAKHQTGQPRRHDDDQAQGQGVLEAL